MTAKQKKNRCEIVCDDIYDQKEKNTDVSIYFQLLKDEMTDADQQEA